MSKKRKINFPPFILVINGVSCSGKTSVAEYFLSRYKNVFSPRGDRIKWMVSDYEPKKHREAVIRMVAALIEQGIEEGFSIVHDWSVSPRQRARYKRLAKKHGMIYLEVNLETDFDVISKRFDVRIEKAKRGARISFVDPVAMKKRYEKHSPLKKFPSFDSGKLSSEQIAKRIISLIRQA